MNRAQATRWTSEVLDEVFVAFARSAELAEYLVFEGARVLAKRLPSAQRQSLDIDSNLTAEFVQAHPDRKEQGEILVRLVRAALVRHFEQQEPVRYELSNLTLRPRPPSDHPRGWNAFEIRLNVSDLRSPTVRGFPAIDLDLAAPEQLLPSSVEPLLVIDREVLAYSLTRIAGEKLRAFLSSLPAYRRKLSGAARPVRARDLHDLAQILRQRPLPMETEFWATAGRELQVACQSRFIDCAGIETFKESWNVTRSTYNASGVIAQEVPFEEAEQALDIVVGFLTEQGVIPFHYALPET